MVIFYYFFKNLLTLLTFKWIKRVPPFLNILNFLLLSKLLLSILNMYSVGSTKRLQLQKGRPCNILLLCIVVYCCDRSWSSMNICSKYKMNLKYDLNMIFSYITCTGIKYDKYLFYLPIFSAINAWKKARCWNTEIMCRKLLNWQNMLGETKGFWEGFWCFFQMRRNLSNYWYIWWHMHLWCTFNNVWRMNPLWYKWSKYYNGSSYYTNILLWTSF